MTLWRVLLEARNQPSWIAEVGAETFDEAIEWFKCWLIVNRPDFVDSDVLTVNGDHIGTCDEEGVVRFAEAGYE